MAEKRDAVTDALESFLTILNKRTGRAAEEKGPKEGLLVLIRKKKKKGALAGNVPGALTGDALTKPALAEK